MPQPTPELDLPELLDSFTISLRAADRADATVKAYRLGINQYIDWCRTHDLPLRLDRTQVQTWMVALHDRGAARATVASRLAGIRQLSKWLTEEGMLDSDPLLRRTPPSPTSPSPRYSPKTNSRHCSKPVRARTSATAATKPSSG